MITGLFTRYCQEMTLLHKFQIGWVALILYIIWMLYKLEYILLALFFNNQSTVLKRYLPHSSPTLS